MDATHRPEAVPSSWTVDSQVDDIEATVAVLHDPMGPRSSVQQPRSPARVRLAGGPDVTCVRSTQDAGACAFHGPMVRRCADAGAGGTAAVTSTPSRRRGRKPLTTRDEIVHAAIGLLETAPVEPLTIARVAQAVGVAPMTIYRYFDDRDELMRAIARAVRSARTPAVVAADASWQEQVGAWMRNLREHVGRYPQLLAFVAAGGHRGWLVDGAELVAILEPLGPWDDRALARAHYWVSVTTMGHVMVESSRPEAPKLEDLYAELGHLPETAATRMARVVPGLVVPPDEVFDLVVERTIAALEPMVPATGSD